MYSSRLYEDTILKTRSIPFHPVLGCFGGGATSFGPDTRTKSSTVRGAEHHRRSGRRLLDRVRHGPGPDEFLALPGVPAATRESVSLGRQVGSSDGPPVLPGRDFCRAH